MKVKNSITVVIDANIGVYRVELTNDLSPGGGGMTIEDGDRRKKDYYDIVARYQGGESVASLAKHYNITPQRVYQILGAESKRQLYAKLPVSALSSRTIRALLCNHMIPVSLEDISPEWVVRNFDAVDLRGIPNLGKKGQGEVIDWLKVRGLKLRERQIVWTPRFNSHYNSRG